MKEFPFTIDEKELPEWYHMAKEFFQEISAYSSSMYEDMNGQSVLTQIRYAAERDYYRSLEKSVIEKLIELRTPLALDGGESAPSQSLSTPDMFSAIEHEPTPAPRR